jgi:hypothetical protein
VISAELLPTAVKRALKCAEAAQTECIAIYVHGDRLAVRCWPHSRVGAPPDATLVGVYRGIPYAAQLTDDVLAAGKQREPA